jgi:hypothetical protein
MNGRSVGFLSHHEGNDPNKQKGNETDLCDACGLASNPAESENGCDDGDDEKCKHPI